MRPLMTAIILLVTLQAYSQNLKFNFVNEEVTKIIEVYSKASGKKFVIDPGVRGRVTLLNPNEISLDEAYNQISSGLAVNGYAISLQGDTYVIQAARQTQRSLIEVSNQLPTLKPERMVTWVVTIKNGPAEDVLKNFRNILTRDGDINIYPRTNQMLITDWTSNIHRISEMLKQVDKLPDPTVQKFVQESQKREAARSLERQKNPPARKMAPEPPRPQESQASPSTDS